MKYLTPDQLKKLDAAWRAWAEQARSDWVAARRSRYLLVYLTMRHTGARLGEATRIRSRDVDTSSNEVLVPTLKQKRAKSRLVPVKPLVVDQYRRAAAIWPEPFAVDGRNFRRVFSMLCLGVGIPEDLAHPHTLRHSHILELLRLGIPMALVRQRVGHARITTTQVYSEFGAGEARDILAGKGVI